MRFANRAAPAAKLIDSLLLDCAPPTRTWRDSPTFLFLGQYPAVASVADADRIDQFRDAPGLRRIWPGFSTSRRCPAPGRGDTRPVVVTADPSSCPASPLPLFT